LLDGVGECLSCELHPFRVMLEEEVDSRQAQAEAVRPQSHPRIDARAHLFG